MVSATGIGRNFGSCLRIFTKYLCAVSIALIFCNFLFAQVNTVRILGTVTDQSGGVVAGAAVAVTNTLTGVARNLTTDEAGEYSAPNLIPGTYAVHVTANGFQAFDRQNILMEIGKDARIDVQLTPGQVTQTIEVTETVPLLDTTSATVSGTLNTSTITDLPLNGRNFENLLVLTPGVVARPGGGTLTTSTNGLRPEDNNYYVEGLDNDEPFTGQSIVNSTLPSGDAATFIPIDAIQEVNVETNAPAEFGRRPGAVINVGLKSGTNSIHGTGYAFGRDGAWDARDYQYVGTQPEPPLSPVDLEQWGGTIGGPILKTKLFYYAGFERQAYNVGNAVVGNAPSTVAGAGPGVSIPDAEADLSARCAANSAQSFCTGSTFVPNALSLKLLPLYGPNTSAGSSVPLGFPDSVSIYNIIGKGDYHLSDHHTFAVGYFYGHGNSTSEDTTITQPYFRSLGQLRAQFVTTSWTWTPNSRWVNDVRVGWNHHLRIVDTADHLTSASSYGINTGVTNPILSGFPTVNVGSFSQLGGDNNLPKGYGPSSDYDLVDHVSYLRGKHAFKFGGEILYFRAPYASYSGGRGVIYFQGGQLFNDPATNNVSTALEDFLAGAPNKANLLNGNPSRVMDQWDYSGFFEDAWRIKSDVTLNLGLRYEYFTPLSEIHNLIGNWEPSVGLEQVGVNIPSSYKPYHKDISPRVGVAWDIGGKGTTVVRLGGGIYYTDIIAGGMVANVALPGHAPGITSIPTGYTLFLQGGTQQAPLNATNGIGSTTISFKNPNLTWTPAGPVFPLGATAKFQCGDNIGSDPAPCSIFAVDRNLVQPHVDSWNLSVQHSLSSNFSVEAAYIGNHGGSLPGIVDLNQINPQSAAEIACGHCESIIDRPYYAKFPYLQYINWMSNIDESNYNALRLTLTQRSFHNLSFVAGYTYSHALDDNSANYNQSLPQDSTHPNLDYGNADFDVRHHFTLSVTYDLPGKKSWGQLLQGWRINSAVLIQSGLPWTAQDTTFDSSATGENTDRWDFYGNPSDFTSGPAPLQCWSGSLGLISCPIGATNTPPTPNAPTVCTKAAPTVGELAQLNAIGCYFNGNSALAPAAIGQWGTAGRNIFRDSGFQDWDFSLFKSWNVKERLTTQFRFEVFNILNHLIQGNPGPIGSNDPSAGNFGCGCESPDQAGTNPILGTGGARAIQLGLKLIF